MPPTRRHYIDRHGFATEPAVARGFATAPAVVRTDAYAGTMAHEFANEPDARRYTMRIDGQLACVLDYSVNRNAIALTHTYTQPPLRGHGYAAELVHFAIDDIESTTPYRIVPTCWYVGEWFEKHPERSALLAR